MVDYIKLKQGLDIPVEGVPSAQILKSIVSETVAVKPTDFKGLIPKLAVKEGDAVKAGTVLFVDKKRPDIKFTSPVSGTVSEIVRGEKRKLLEIRIKADPETVYAEFNLPKPEAITAEEAVTALLESGLWPCIKQRPYGIVPNPEVRPKAIYISGFDTAPLAADYDFILKDEVEDIQTAVNVLAKIAPKIHFGLCARTHASSPFHKISGVEFHIFDGPHPAGNVGVQINHVCPINKGDLIWTVNLQMLAIMGRFFNTGRVDMRKTVAVGGPRVSAPGYIKCISGMCFSNIADMVNDNVEKLQQGCPVRYISGNILTGTNVGKDGYLGFYDDCISLITEGTYSNLNGGVRAFVMTNKYAQVFPMNIYPVYLLKAILAEDIDKMEQLGIYEVVEEDFALCEYIDPSKIDIQAIVSKGIDLMIKEMA